MGGGAPPQSPSRIFNASSLEQEKQLAKMLKMANSSNLLGLQRFKKKMSLARADVIYTTNNHVERSDGRREDTRKLQHTITPPPPSAVTQRAQGANGPLSISHWETGLG